VDHTVLPANNTTPKVQPTCILLKQEMMGRQWHQLDHMQIICTSVQPDNHASTSSLPDDPRSDPGSSGKHGQDTFSKTLKHLLSESVEATEDVVCQLTAGDAAAALTLRQFTLATLHQFGSDVVARSVLYERLTSLLATSLGRTAVQRLVLQH